MTVTEFIEKELSKENKNNYYKFKLLINDIKYSRIHPLKQKQVYELIQYLLQLDINKEILKIAVFGSVLTLKCTAVSDIDLLILTKDNSYKKPRIPQEYGETDILIYTKESFDKDSSTNSFLKEVKERGYIIYEQVF